MLDSAFVAGIVSELAARQALMFSRAVILAKLYPIDR